MLVAGGNVPSSDEFMTDPRTPDLMRQSAVAWGAAHQAAGVSPEAAREAAATTSAFYAPRGKIGPSVKRVP